MSAAKRSWMATCSPSSAPPSAQQSRPNNELASIGLCAWPVGARGRWSVRGRPVNSCDRPRPEPGKIRCCQGDRRRLGRSAGLRPKRRASHAFSYQSVPFSQTERLGRLTTDLGPDTPGASAFRRHGSPERSLRIPRRGAGDPRRSGFRRPRRHPCQRRDRGP